MQSGCKITEEMLENTGGELFTAGNVAHKGLQQFFTPAPLAELICRVLDTEGRPYSVCDLTAGSGALLKPFASLPAADTYGIEIDKSQITRGIGIHHGNINRVFPFMSELRVQFDKFLLNPPFGLEWEWNGKTRNSVEVCLEMAESLSTSASEGVLICDDRNWPGVENVCEGLDLYFWAVLTVKGIFAPASECVCRVAFWSQYNDYRPPTVGELDYSKFKEWSPDVESMLKKRHNWLRTGFSTSDPKEQLLKVKACVSAAKQEAESEVQLFNLVLRGKQLKVHVSDYQAYKIIKGHSEAWLDRVRSWTGLPVKYFALNTLEFDHIQEAINLGMITAGPGVVEALEKAVADAPRYTAPYYPLKPTQRLGYLEKLNRIQCIKSDPELDFEEGLDYPISVQIQEWTGSDVKTITRKSKEGEGLVTSTRELQTQGKYLKIRINNIDFNESNQNIEYITSHFQIPNPGDITNYMPDLYAKYKAELAKLESPSFHFRDFQLDDLARFCCREGGVLAWEQGLGKMIGGLAWLQVKKYKRCCIVAPQDLIPQWTKEAKEKFGLDLIRLTSPDEARLLAKRPKPAAGSLPEFYIVHFEALSRNQATTEPMPEQSWPVGILKQIDGEGKEVHHVKKETSKNLCPHCHQGGAWNGKYCNPRETMIVTHKGQKPVESHGCGYVHYKLRRYNMAHYLKNTFSAVVIDEGTKIKGDYSQMGVAVRSLRPKGRMILTGTPVKNFLHDAFWLLWWAAGATQTEAFPYGYDAKSRFTEDFCVIEFEKACDANGRKNGPKKTRPEISSVNMLWKTLAPNILRRRKSETGERLVSKRLLPVRVPFGSEQQEVYRWWLQNFGQWYAERPDTDMNSSALATALAGLLGQLWKLRFATTVPGAERLIEHNGMKSSSSLTPKLLACLELIREAMEARESVVVFNVMKDANHLLKAQLDAVGIKSRIVDGDSRPADRAITMQEFKAGKFQVLLAGLEAVNLGHNLETARRAIVYSLPFDLASFDQGINRIHRLTSVKDVVVHVLLVKNSFDEKMWDLIERKGKYAGLALDGQLGYDEVEEVSLNEFARELRDEFICGEAISEVTIEEKIREMWQGLHLITDAKGNQRGAAAGLLDTIQFSSFSDALSL